MNTNDMSFNAVLRTQSLVKTFGSVTALAGVDISIPPGQSIAIMGPSGSGKSTLLHCLAGILLPEAGACFLGSTPISDLRDKERSRVRAKNCGFVFQDGQLLPELTAEENVAMPLLLQKAGRSDSLRAARELLTRLGIGDLTRRYPSQVSGGQAQRIAIARSLVHRPSVVFADEPTGALDQRTGHEVMQVLTATTRAAGTALVVVTHDLEVAKWCERLIEIRDGLVHTDRLLTEHAPYQDVPGTQNKNFGMSLQPDGNDSSSFLGENGGLSL